MHLNEDKGHVLHGLRTFISHEIKQSRSGHNFHKILKRLATPIPLPYRKVRPTFAQLQTYNSSNMSLTVIFPPSSVEKVPFTSSFYVTPYRGANTIEVVGRGINSQLWCRRFNIANTTADSEWHEYPEITMRSAPVAVTLGTNQLHVFYLGGTAHSVQHTMISQGAVIRAPARPANTPATTIIPLLLFRPSLRYTLPRQ
jgi:hypothetical protein